MNHLKEPKIEDPVKKQTAKRTSLMESKNRIAASAKSKGKYLWTIANTISISKIFLVPFFIYFYLLDSFIGYCICLLIIALSESTDYFDGYIARRYNMVSDVGKLIDPMADSLFRFSMYLTFYIDRTIPVWVVFIFFFRDIIVAYVRTGLSVQGIVLAAKKSGKMKAVFQATGGILIISNKLAFIGEFIQRETMERIILFVVIIVCSVVTYSLFDYLIPSIKIMIKKKRR